MGWAFALRAFEVEEERKSKNQVFLGIEQTVITRGFQTLPLYWAIHIYICYTSPCLAGIIFDAASSSAMCVHAASSTYSIWETDSKKIEGIYSVSFRGERKEPHYSKRSLMRLSNHRLRVCRFLNWPGVSLPRNGGMRAVLFWTRTCM